MTPQEFDDILTKTLGDGALSGSEKRALMEILSEANTTDQQLAFYRHRAFEIASQNLISPGSHAVVDWLESVIKLLTPNVDNRPRPIAESYFSPQDDCPGKIIHLFEQARTSVEICVFTITDDRVARAIQETHLRGVKVRIISDNEKSFDLGSDITRLAESGIPVRIDETDHHMHHKFAIFDGELVLTGSYNWTRSAANFNEENFIVTNEPRFASSFSDLFESLWKKLGR